MASVSDHVRAGVSFCKALFLLCSAKTEEAKSDKLSLEVEAEVVAAAWEVDVVVASAEVLVEAACDGDDVEGVNVVVELVDLPLTCAKTAETVLEALDTEEAAIGGATKAVAVEVGLAVAVAAANVS